MTTARGDPPPGRLLAMIVAGLWFGCGAPDLPPRPLVVGYAGCAQTLFPGPVCVTGPERRLVLWVATPTATEVEIRADGSLVVEAEPLGEGWRYAVTIPKRAGKIEVARKGPEPEPAFWSLRVSSPRPPTPGELDVQEEIRKGTAGTADHSGSGTFDLIQRLELNPVRFRLLELKNLAPADLLSLESRYRLAYPQALLADKVGDFRTTMTRLDQAIELAERGNLTAFGEKARQKRALVLANLGRSREATEEFARLAKTVRFSSPCEEGQFLSNWAWALLLANEVAGGAAATIETPERLLESAIEKIRSDPTRCDSKAVLNARLNLVLAHLQSGRPDLAHLELVSARRAKTKTSLFLQLWELDLEARIELAYDRPEPALAIYRRLDRIAESVGSPDGRLRAALGLARTSDRLGDRDGALAILAEAEKLLDGQSLKVPLYEGRQTFVSQREGVASLEVELWLAADRVEEALASARRGRSRVLHQHDLNEHLAALAPADKARWSEEIAKYTRARAEIDQAVHSEWGLSPAEMATDRAARERKARDTAEALERAIAGILKEPPTLPLAAVPSGELLLAFHPLPRSPKSRGGDWVAFAADGRRKPSVHRFALAEALQSEATLAKATLLPFRQQILAAERIRILPYGPLRDVDFQALPFGDDVLLSAKPVIYGLDIAPNGTARPEGRERRALLVANPSGNLPFAVAEATAVGRGIRRWRPRWRIERLVEAAADAERVRSGLAGADLFHFSGHGRFSGVGGTDSSLLLAADRRLTVGEVLVLPSVPRWVLLSGCETAATAPEARVEGLGLANAFVLAGSRAVVASVRSVDDRTAGELFEDLYRRWDGGTDLPRALQEALLAWRTKYPEADWRNFRLVEP